MLETLKKYKVRKLKILVCNDDQFSRIVVPHTLQNIKYVGKVELAENGQEALDKIQ